MHKIIRKFVNITLFLRKLFALPSDLLFLQNRRTNKRKDDAQQREQREELFIWY